MRANIEAERGRKRIPKYKLSRMLGISQETYNRYINGENSIPSDVLVNMRNIFGCSIVCSVSLTNDRKSAERRRYHGEEVCSETRERQGCRPG